MRVGVYTRKSYYTDKSDSVKMQLSECREYVSRCFGTGAQVIPYEDDGYIRSDMDRPAMNRLREDVGSGLLDCVVIYRIDRVSSDMMDFCSFYAFLKDHGVKFVTVKDGIDTTTPMGEAMMYLAVIFSGLEIGNDSLRIRDNLQHLAARGFWCGGMAPYGYRITNIKVDGKTHKTLTPDPEEIAEKEKLINILLGEDLSLGQLERRCRELGIRSQRGRVLSTTQLYQILGSPYCCPATQTIYDYYKAKGCIIDDGSPRELWDGSHGVMVYGRTTERKVGKKKRHLLAPPEEWRVSIGRHDPTLTEERWLAIQEHFTHKPFNRVLVHDPPLLKGVLRCKCGRLMTLARKRRKTDGGITTWYACPLRVRFGPGECDMSSIRAPLLDDKVMEIFKQIQLDESVIEQYARMGGDSPKEDPEPIAKKIKAVERRIETLTASIPDAGDSTAVKYIIAEIERQDAELLELQQRHAIALRDRVKQDVRERSLKAERDRIVEAVANLDNLDPWELNAIAKEVIQSATWDGEALSITL